MPAPYTYTEIEFKTFNDWGRGCCLYGISMSGNKKCLFDLAVCEQDTNDSQKLTLSESEHIVAVHV